MPVCKNICNSTLCRTYFFTVPCVLHRHLCPVGETLVLEKAANSQARPCFVYLIPALLKEHSYSPKGQLSVD